MARSEVHLRVCEPRRAAQPTRACGISSGIARAQQRQDRLKPVRPSGSAGGRRDRLRAGLAADGAAAPSGVADRRGNGSSEPLSQSSDHPSGWIGGGATTRPPGRVNGRQTNPGAERQRAVQQQSSDCTQQPSGCPRLRWRLAVYPSGSGVSMGLQSQTKPRNFASPGARASGTLRGPTPRSGGRTLSPPALNAWQAGT